jgi:hypothetical protein
MVEFTKREMQVIDYMLSDKSKRPGKACKRLKMTFKTLCRINDSIYDKLNGLKATQTKL